MNKKMIVTVIFLTFVFATFEVYGFQSSKTAFGILFKVVNLVEKKSAGKDWEKAYRNDALFGDDNLRTSKRSIAIIKFTDRSIIRLLENSEIRMLGEKDRKMTSNKLEILYGVIGFDVIKRQNEQYTFTSPTSVASIRGTKGIFNHQEDMDIVIIKEGIVNLKNLKSGQEQEVTAGKIAFSYPNGVLSVRDATSDEMNGVDSALSSGDIQKEQELKLELKDAEGNKRNLKIKYKE